MTWGQFKRQYDAQGREKADGYAPGDFDDMSEDERQRAREMMLDRALTGDDIDLSGLRYIGDASTAATLAGVDDAARRFGWGYDIVRHQVLYELTGEQRYLMDLSRYLDSREDDVKERAAYALTRYVLPPDAEPFLMERIIDGRHEGALIPLLKSWIGIHQQAICDTMCLQRHIGLVRAVSDTTPSRRQPILTAAAEKFNAA